MAQKYKDVVGLKFGRCTIIQEGEPIVTPSGKKRRRVLYKCDCGAEKEACLYDLIYGSILSCGCYHKDNTHDKLLIDITGEKFGKLTVIKEDGRDSSGQVLWLCKCECGNETHTTAARLKNGTTKSCGCLCHEGGKNNAKDLTGMEFGALKVIERDTSIPSGNGIFWICECACGNRVSRSTKDLMSGHFHSCGCKYGYEPYRLNLIGEQFGNLTVIAFAGIKDRHTTWKCQCACGAITIVDVGRLRSGNTKSCGCIVSDGEYAIAKFLTAHQIPYEKQKEFIGCCDKRSLKFDFWLPTYGLCIEFDGIQHHQVVDSWNDDEEKFEQRKTRDAIKDKYCEENGIVLLRIPYWEKKNQESILKEWLFLDDE